MSISTKKITYLLTLSSAFEYYDFIIYGLMANYISILFFSVDNPFISQIGAYSIFTLGYLVRPLGGVILGIIGDFGSRRKVFIIGNLILA
ncbi:MAG: MFS transporter, partial [Pseudomonadota bacterium]